MGLNERGERAGSNDLVGERVILAIGQDGMLLTPSGRRVGDARVVLLLPAVEFGLGGARDVLLDGLELLLLRADSGGGEIPLSCRVLVGVGTRAEDLDGRVGTNW